MTAVFALVGCAILAGIVWLSYERGRERAATRRKPGAVTPPPAPADALDTAERDDLGLLRRLLALEARFEQVETRLVDLKEATDRRFGRLHAAKSRDNAQPDDGDGEPGDPAQLELRPFRAPNGAPSPDARRRVLVPRR